MVKCMNTETDEMTRDINIKIEMRETELEERYRCFQSFWGGGGEIIDSSFKLGRVLIQIR